MISIGRAHVKKTILEAKKPGSDDEGQEHMVVVFKKWRTRNEMRHAFENIIDSV